jgi:hypothetical protein
METKFSLSCSQETTTGPYPEPDESSPHTPTLFNIHFNIIIPKSVSLWLLIVLHYTQYRCQQTLAIAYDSDFSKFTLRYQFNPLTDIGNYVYHLA